ALNELKETVAHLQSRLTKLVRIHFMENQDKLQRLTSSYVFHYPKQLLNEKVQYVDRLSDQLINRFTTIHRQKEDSYQHISKRLTLQHQQTKFEKVEEKLLTLQKNLIKETDFVMQEKQKILIGLVDKLTLLNPLEIMKRGFSVTYTEEGDIVKTVEEVSSDDQIQVKLVNGILDCKVENVRRDMDE